MIAPFLFIGSEAAHAEVISVEEAVKKGWVRMSMSAKGGHVGNVMKMKMENLSTRNLDLKLEAGRRLDSRDSSEQDILVARQENFALAPKEKKQLTVAGFCCQAHNSSPDSGDVFGVGKMADDKLVKLAQFIDQKKMYNSSSAQDAVWVLSDNNPIESIYGEDAFTKELREYVSKLSGKPVPKYTVKYESSAGDAAAFSNRAMEIAGDFDYELFGNGTVTFGIYDKDNRLVEAFFADRPQNKGRYAFRYSFKASDLPKGTYYAKLRVDGQLRKEQKFEF